jgi:RNA polymerase sigma-70 factor (ECF subfamily)
MGEPVDDAALVQRCLSGDSEALRSLVLRYEHVVFSLCVRMLRDRHEAEDVAQEVFLRVVRHLAKWDAARPLRPWVLAIAANRCRTWLSRRARQPTATDGCEAWSSEQRSSSDLGEELQSGIAQLRPDYRTCFLLYYQQELSVEEIARSLDCPIGTVKTWLFRARKELAERLKQRGVVDEKGHELHDL